MPKAPQYTPQVQQSGLPNVRSNVSAPLEAFGGGQSAADLNRSTGNAIDETLRYASEEKQKSDQIVLVEKRNELLKLSNYLQYNPQSGFLNKKGEQIKGLPEEVQTDWNSGLEQIRAGLSNTEQRAAFDKMASEESNSIHRDLLKHLSVEGVQYDRDTTKANIRLEQEAAINKYNDPEFIKLSTEKIKSSLTGYGQRNGHAPEATELEIRQALSETHSGVIERMLLGAGGKAAGLYLNENRADMSARDILVAESRINKEVNLESGNELFNMVRADQKFKRSDGTIDESKAESLILNNDKLTEQDKNEQIGFLKSRMSEYHQDLKRDENSRQREFMNGAITYRKTGKSLDQAIRLANKVGRDPYEQEIYVQAARKMYESPTQGNPNLYISIWEQVESGTDVKTKIDDAMKTGQITVSQWENLRKSNFRNQLEGVSGEGKIFKDRLKSIARELYPDDTQKRNDFMTTVDMQTQGKSYEEKRKYAEDLKGKQPGSSDGWFSSNKDKYKIVMDQRDKSDIAWGTLYSDIGEDETKSIGSGILFSGKGSWNLSDIDSFAAQYGGYSNIKKGTPVNNAIQSINRMNEQRPASRKIPVVKDNIDALLKKYPNGVFNG